MHSDDEGDWVEVFSFWSLTGLGPDKAHHLTIPNDPLQADSPYMHLRSISEVTIGAAHELNQPPKLGALSSGPKGERKRQSGPGPEHGPNPHITNCPSKQVQSFGRSVSWLDLITKVLISGRVEQSSN